MCGRFKYDMFRGGAHYSCNERLFADAEIDLTSFIARLDGMKGNGPVVNCQDCASAVVSLSNLAGCDLWCNRMGRLFKTRSFLPIGVFEEVEAEFVFHEVAWEGLCGDQDLVYDACIQYDGGEVLGCAPVEFVVPQGVMFCDGSEQAPFVYRERLSKDGSDGYGNCSNLYQRIRRAIR